MSKSKKTSFEAAESLAFMLLEAGAVVERRLDRALSIIRGVSFSEYRLLRELGRAHEGAAMRVELAEAVGLTPSAVTRALKPLEKLGFVTTVKSERDARRSLAKLTRGGVELLEDAQGIVRDVIADLPVDALEEAGITEFLQLVSERTLVERKSRAKRRLNRTDN